MGVNLMPRPMSVKIEWEAQELINHLEDITEHLDEKIAAIFKANEVWAMAWMKANAPWTDNTGRARAGLTAVATSAGSTHEMLLFYTGVNYGIWLEIANSGRFQILGPAMRYISQKILKDMQDLLSGKPPTNLPSREIPPQARKILKKPIARHSGGSRRSRKAYGARNRNRYP